MNRRGREWRKRSEKGDPRQTKEQMKGLGGEERLWRDGVV